MEDKILSHSNAFISEQYDDGNTLVLDERTGNIHVLNQTAAFIYDVSHTVSYDNAKQKYLKAFKSDDPAFVPDEAAKDFEEALHILIEKGLICFEGDCGNS